VKTDPLAAGAAAPTPRTHDSAHVAAKQLESFFLRQLLAESRPQGGMLDGGFAGDTFKQMLDEAIADKMSAAGGVGMAQMFARQLDSTGQAAGHAAPAIAALAPGAAPPAAPAITAALPASPGAIRPLDPTQSPHALPVGSHALPTPTGLDALAPGAPRFLLPVAGRPSSGYGLRADPIHGGTVNHPGFDLAAATGTEVAAAARGTVVHAGPAGTYGNLVTVRHENGFETRYAHLSEVDVKVGDQVEAGAELGKVGSTGYSTGPHLHFEVRRDGKAIDPAPLLPLNSSVSRTTR
jgi:murein DD-endopeptidase MepM/ murein hydrolase activator NlpD